MLGALDDEPLPQAAKAIPAKASAPAMRNPPPIERNFANLVFFPYGLMGEDFAEFAARVPSVMVMLGCAPEGGACRLHSPEFEIDERVLERGASLLALGSLTMGRF